jgi:hypothetical protein
MTHQEIEQLGCHEIVKATYDVIRSHREMRWTSRAPERFRYKNVKKFNR